MSDYLVIGQLTRSYEMVVTAQTPEEAHVKAMQEQYLWETEGSVLSRTVTCVTTTTKHDNPAVIQEREEHAYND